MTRSEQRQIASEIAERRIERDYVQDRRHMVATREARLAGTARRHVRWQLIANGSIQKWADLVNDALNQERKS